MNGAGAFGAGVRRAVRAAHRRGRRVLSAARAPTRCRTTSGSCSARRSPVCSGASSSTTTTCIGGCRAIPAQPPPPLERWGGRNHSWTHLNNHDVISMPDTWEYPWYAAWDLAFHTIPLAMIDPRVRQGSARAAAARVVHAPERPAPGLRVGVRRRESAGARLGGDARLSDRAEGDGRGRHRSFSSASFTNCSSTSPGG